MSACRPASFESTTLTVEADKFKYEYLSKPKEKAAVEGVLKAFFGSPVKLAFSLIENGTRSDLPTSGDLDANGVFKDAPQAKRLFDLLGGEIVS